MPLTGVPVLDLQGWPVAFHASCTNALAWHDYGSPPQRCPIFEARWNGVIVDWVPINSKLAQVLANDDWLIQRLMSGRRKVGLAGSYKKHHSTTAITSKPHHCGLSLTAKMLSAFPVT